MAKKDTYQLLKQWLRGAAGYKEEQELNRQAGGDDFLAEAMDGYGALPEGDHTERVQRLKQRVQAQTRRKRRMPAYWLRVAAAVLLIGFAGGVFWYLNQPTKGMLTEKTNTVTEEEKSADIENSDESTTLDKAEKSTEAITSQKKSAPSKTEAQPPEPSVSQKITQPPTPEAPAPIAQLPSASSELRLEETEEDVVIEDMLENENLPGLEETAMPAFNDTNEYSGQEPQSEAIEPPKPVAEEKESAEIAMRKNKAAPPPTAYHFDVMPGGQSGDKKEDTFVLRGKVVEQSTGEPIIAANVQIIGTNQGTVTDLDGNFSLEIPGDTAEIMINYVGFQSDNLFVERGDTVEIRLSASEMLEEVVVTSHGISKRNKAQAQNQQAPEPVNGFRKFKKYIRQNLRYPEPAKQASVKGKVELSFAIDNNGRPVDIKVESSLGYGCDEEAVRLLSEGPDWEAGKGRGRYTFKFP